jgi:hypothetical protein
MSEFQLHGSADAPVLGKHGWQEQGGRQVGVYGRAWHTGECFGVGWAPFELSPAGTWAFLTEVIFPATLRAHGWLETLRTGTPTLTVEVYRKSVATTLVLTPTSPDGMVETRYYAASPDGRATLTIGTAYEAERQRQIGRTEMEVSRLMETGASLAKAATEWKLADLKDGSPKGPTVHFKNEGARVPYCGSRSYGLVTTTDASKVTCSRCQKALDTAAREQAERDALVADAATLTEWLRANGRKTKSEMKKGLGWDTKRVNRAVERAERPWENGKYQPGAIRSVYLPGKPETFEAA